MSELPTDHDVLIQRYVEGLLTESEAAALLAALENDSALGQRLLEHLHTDAMLDEVMAGGVPLEPPVASGRRRFSLAALAAVATLAVCLTLAGTVAWRSLITPRAEVGQVSAADEVVTASVALLARGVNLEWAEGSPAPEAGAPLLPGWLHLKAGLAQIEFYQGARVLIEGPARFKLISSGEATFSSGKLTAHVPPQARGFRVNTPEGAVVDLGTEFGLEVNAATSQVHVFKGEVELHPNAAAMRSLKEGQAMAFDGPPAALQANSAAFATINDLDAKTEASQRTLFQAWLAEGARRNADPGLLIRYDFQEAAMTRTLHNLAQGGAGIPEASIVGCSWTQGRWPGKQALEFRNVSDRVRLSLPGETRALTLSVWVRVNALDSTYNSLFMSEGWGDRRVHWQIIREGKVRLGVAGKPSQSHVDYDSPVLFTPERFGRWMHLAVVFNPDTREVRHYADGEVVARMPLADSSPLKIGVAELGNWNDRRSPGGVAIRHLSGAMDEFALWNRALSDAEVATLAR